MIDYLIDKDKALFLFLNGMGAESWDGFWLFVSHKLSALPLYLWLLWLCLVHFRWKRTLVILVCVAIMIATTDQLANVFKYGFERLRPCHDQSLIPYMRSVVCGGQFGYFSAHSASSMAVAVFFGLLFQKYYNWLIYILLVWSLAVGFSRIYLGVHFPTDVLTGFVFGALIGVLFVRLARIIFRKVVFDR